MAGPARCRQSSSSRPWSRTSWHMAWHGTPRSIREIAELCFVELEASSRDRTSFWLPRPPGPTDAKMSVFINFMCTVGCGLCTHGLKTCTRTSTSTNRYCRAAPTRRVVWRQFNGTSPGSVRFRRSYRTCLPSPYHRLGPSKRLGLIITRVPYHGVGLSLTFP